MPKVTLITILIDCFSSINLVCIRLLEQKEGRNSFCPVKFQKTEKIFLLGLESRVQVVKKGKKAGNVLPL